MVDFLTAKKAAAEIESIISEAKIDGSIILITPYVKIPDDLISRLRQAARLRNVHIKVICRKDDLRPDQRATIEEIQNLELLFNERVHAKCFYNQDSMVITSLNLYDSSVAKIEKWECYCGVIEKAIRKPFLQPRTKPSL